MEWNFEANYYDYWRDFWKWHDEKKKTFVVSNVGDYSLFISKSLKSVFHFRIKTKHSQWYEPTEIIKTEEGCILYFNECIKDVFKNGCIYPARVVDEFKWDIVTPQRLNIALKNLYNSKKSKRKRKRKSQFQPAYIQDWEWEVVSTTSEEPKRRRCRRNKQLINQTQDGK